MLETLENFFGAIATALFGKKIRKKVERYVSIKTVHGNRKGGSVRKNATCYPFDHCHFDIIPLNLNYN